MSTFDELLHEGEPFRGFLTDGQILAALNASYLMEQGTWHKDQVRHASYTLRLGDKVEVVKSTDSTRHFRIVPVAPGKPFDLEPFDTARLYSQEVLRMPDSVLGLTVARGLLFVEALGPENTYVDPGFPGPLYTTVVNLSKQVVPLTHGMSIARLFFYRLSRPVDNPYRSGSSQGIAQQLDGVPSRLASTREECATDTDEHLASVIQSLPLSGNHIVELIQREQQSRTRTAAAINTRLVMVAVGALAWPVLLQVALNNAWLRENSGAIGAGVIGSLLAMMIGALAGIAFKAYQGKP